MTVSRSVSEPTTGRPMLARSGRAVLPLVAIGLAILVAIVISRAAKGFEPAVLRFEIGAVFLLGAGIAVQSEKLVAFATGPAIVGLLLGILDSDDVVWGSSLLAGCLWYLATEAALSSIELGDGLAVSASVVHRRSFEVASVVSLAAVIGVVSLAGASLAPDRSVLVQVLLLAFVLIGLVIAGRHLAATSGDNRAEEAH